MPCRLLPRRVAAHARVEASPSPCHRRRGDATRTRALKRDPQQGGGRPQKLRQTVSGAAVEYGLGNEVERASGRWEDLRESLAVPLVRLQRGVESRVTADPDFLFKIIWEIVQDQFIIVFTVLSSCGLPAFWTPDQLANACLLHATAFFNDALLMYFLAPTAAAAAAATKDLGGDESSGKDAKKKTGKGSHQIAHMFEPGESVTLSDRLRCWLDKFFLYAPLGMLTALISSVVLQGFLKEPMNLMYLSRVGLLGFLHLGVSSNTRYQLINGADVLYYRVLDKGAARGATIASRLVNQIAGGKLFLLLSSLVLCN